jgi:hypothetical protein
MQLNYSTQHPRMTREEPSGFGSLRRDGHISVEQQLDILNNGDGTERSAGRNKED